MSVGKLRVLSAHQMDADRDRSAQVIDVERIDGARFDVGTTLRDAASGREWEIVTFNFSSFIDPEHIRTRRSIQVRGVGHRDLPPRGELEIL